MLSSYNRPAVGGVLPGPGGGVAAFSTPFTLVFPPCQKLRVLPQGMTAIVIAHRLTGSSTSSSTRATRAAAAGAAEATA